MPRHSGRYERGRGLYRVAAHSEKGPVRRHQQDAWAVAWPRVPALPPALAVFDGVGGLPQGGAASETAARTFANAFAGVTVQHLVERLDMEVHASGGFATAVAFVPSGEANQATVVWAGDSSAYTLVDGELRRLTNPHRDDRGRLLHFIGSGCERGSAITVQWTPSSSILLCSDGVDRHVAPGVLETALDDPSPSRGLDRVFDALEATGMSDNATAILARFLPPPFTRQGSR